MAIYQIKWSSLLHLTELEFIPEQPKVLKISDELIQTLSWLTAATKHDRKLLRCNEQGALLVGNAWDNLTEVELDELYPQPNTPDTFTATKANKGVLAASSTEIVRLDFLKVGASLADTIYIPPAWLHFFPYPTQSVVATVVPAATGTASYVGLTGCN